MGRLLLGLRNRDLNFITSIKELYTDAVDETIEIDGMLNTGLASFYPSKYRLKF